MFTNYETEKKSFFLVIIFRSFHSALFLIKLVELPAKVSSGIRKESVAAVITNVWLLEINETYPIYRYDVQIFELYPGKKGTVEPRAKEITRNTREE